MLSSIDKQNNYCVPIGKKSMSKTVIKIAYRECRVTRASFLDSLNIMIRQLQIDLEKMDKTADLNFTLAREGDCAILNISSKAEGGKVKEVLELWLSKSEMEVLNG